jgi:hypothetical protein
VPGYEIQGLLGRGGMGVVYKARHLATKRVVALKMIRMSGPVDDSARARFHAECEAVARLQHPHIVQVFEVGEVDGQPYCALEFVAGGSLATKLKGKPLPPTEAAQIVEALAGAMHLTHSRNVVHRDLKPANVLLTEDGTPKITDFGLARQLDADGGQTHTGIVLGTPSYMAPEQASGQAHAAGPAADTYALGAILYECLTGRAPFRGATVLETLDQVRSQEPMRPRLLRPGLPRDLETICLKCLRKEPDKRYASARELGDDLARYRRGEPVLARPVGMVGRLARWARRRPAVAGLLLALIVLSLGGSAALIVFRLDAEEAHTAEANTRAERAQERERLVAESLRNAQDTLAESLMRPVGYDDRGLTSAELDTFRDLARSPSERVRLRFVEKALAGPETALRLGRRADVAAHSVVGLDRERRQRVLRLLSDKLHDAGTDREVRIACILLGVALETKDEALCREGARTAAEAMAQTTRRSVLIRLANALVALASRLSSEEAERVSSVAGRNLLDAMKRTSNSQTKCALGGAMIVLGERLKTEQASAAVRDLFDALTKTTESNMQAQLRQTVMGLASRLTPEQTADAVRQASQAMSKATDSMLLASLGEAMSPLAYRLTPEAASENALQLVELMARKSNGNAPFAVCMVVGSLASRLSPEQASAVTHKLLDVMAKTTEAGTLFAFDQAIRPLARRLTPEQTAAALRKALEAMNRATKTPSLFWFARVAGELTVGLSSEEAALVAPKFLDTLDRTSDPEALSSLARSISVLAGSLTPERAGQTSAAAAQKALDGMAKTTDPATLFALGEAIEKLAVWLPSTQASIAIQKALDVLSKTADVDAQTHVARTVTALAPRLTPDQSASAASRLLNVIERATDAQALSTLGEAISALVDRLSSHKASNTAAAAIPKLYDTMTRLQSADLTYLPRLGEVANGLVSHLTPTDSRRLATTVAPKLLEAMSQVTNDATLSALGQSISVLASGLPSDQAQSVSLAAAQKVLDALAKTTDASSLSNLAQAVAKLVVRLTPDQASTMSALASLKLRDAMTRTTEANQLTWLVTALGLLTDHLSPEQAEAAAMNLLDVMTRIPPAELTSHFSGALNAHSNKLPLVGLIRLLEHSTCVGMGRATVLKALCRRIGSPAPQAAALAAGAALAPPPSFVTVVALTVHGESLYPGGRRPFADLWDAVVWLQHEYPEWSSLPPPK